MQKIEVLVGCPASGKSFHCQQVMKKEPGKWRRINNDSLRMSIDYGEYSPENEKTIRNVRNFLIKECLSKGFNLLIDNVNAGKRNFDEICKLAKESRLDVQVYEKPFYEELDVLIERDSKREGKARVGEVVVKKWFKELGGKQHKHYKARVEIFQERRGNLNQTVDAPAHVPGVPEAVLCDLDGTLALIHGRSPYDASDCDIKDLPNVPVIETVLAHYKAGRKIIFCSGREDKYRPETIRFIEKYVNFPFLVADENGNIVKQKIQEYVPIQYQLFMRKTDDFRKDAIIKEEIYQNEIEGKYNVLMVLDDRNSVCDFWRSKGLTCWQVAPGDF